MVRRRPWVAFLVSLLWPGLGQLYAARPARARNMAAIGLVLIAAQGLYLRFIDPDSPAGIAVGLGLAVGGIAFSIYAAADAARLSRRQREVTLTRYNRPSIYLAIVALFVAVIAATYFLQA